MVKNLFGGFGSDDDNSFETGNPVQQGVKKVANAATAQVAKQTKQVTQDVVSQLFGADFSKSEEDKSAQASKPQSAATAATAQKLGQMQKQQQQPQPQNEFPGIQTEADQKKFADLTSQLGEEKKKDQQKEQAQQKTHMSSYFDPSIGTLETQLKKLKQQEEQKKAQQQQEEDQKKEQKKEMKLEEQKKEEQEAIAVQRARTNAERKSAGAG